MFYLDSKKYDKNSEIPYEQWLTLNDNYLQVKDEYLKKLSLEKILNFYDSIYVEKYFDFEREEIRQRVILIIFEITLKHDSELNLDQLLRLYEIGEWSPTQNADIINTAISHIKTADDLIMIEKQFVGIINHDPIANINQILQSILTKQNSFSDQDYNLAVLRYLFNFKLIQDMLNFLLDYPTLIKPFLSNYDVDKLEPLLRVKKVSGQHTLGDSQIDQMHHIIKDIIKSKRKKIFILINQATANK